MKTLARTIYIDGKSYRIWLALSKKRYNKVTVFSLMYFVEDPKIQKTKPIKIKEGFKTEEAAIQYGKNYMREAYKRMIPSENGDNKEEDIDWDNL